MNDEFLEAARPPGGRGATVLTLGILSIVLAGCFPAGLVLGILAVLKAKEDLPRFASGEYVGEGHGLTKAGQICGIVGLCLAGLQCLVLLAQLAIMLLVVAAGAGP